MGLFACFPDPSAFWKGTGKGCYASFSSSPMVVIKSIKGHSTVNVIQDIIVLSIPLKILFMDNPPIKRPGLLALLFMGAL